MKIGFFSFGCLGTPLEESLEKIAKIGYEAVEVSTWHKSWGEKILRALGEMPGNYKVGIPTWTRGHAYPGDLSPKERKDIKKMCDSLGLKVSALSAHLNCFDASEIFANRSPGQAIKEYLRDCFELASQWDVEVITTSSGRAPMGMSSQESWNRLVDMIGFELDQAREYQVKIGLEAHFGEIVRTPQDLLKLMEQIHDSFLGINLDCSHFVLGNFDPLKATNALAKYVVHTHLKGMKGKLAVAPGEDEEFPTQAWVRTMRDSGYDGVIAIELMPEIDTLPQKAQKAFSYVDRILGDVSNR